ncbi:lysophospholipid acyltransferase family protein [Roseivivax isoporae]|uniref:1-acyl-sn-glycerol-3-phosphate acyltransferase n=1 Tax=Roseivivax isoporae LMG 25204 TaxID=1449351 RepID=X7F3T9_9RHOB|nr:lysophospholipid acyltransferase family protein [Roseivivax isoporae]ETX27547.1 1-acyl-sn-glycerol-3-phosphate acyltransferase [Roseivivax isoporae LMG 25204]
MSTTWNDAPPPLAAAPGVTGWLRAVLRGLCLGAVVFGGLVVLLAVRLVERPLCGMDRPVTPHVTRLVCRWALVTLRLRVEVTGRPMRTPGAMVANHASWLDIFVLNAQGCLYFVSKSEVAGWPGIGWLARATGTVFIRRDRREAAAQTRLFEERLRHGHRLVFFPEGTSTDGQRILPFKTTLFAAFLVPELAGRLTIQAVTVDYRAPEGADPRFYGWWGDMSFGAHLLRMLSAPRQGRVLLTFHPGTPVSDHRDRKTLARHLELQVRSVHPAGPAGTGAGALTGD